VGEKKENNILKKKGFSGKKKKFVTDREKTPACTGLKRQAKKGNLKKKGFF